MARKKKITKAEVEAIPKSEPLFLSPPTINAIVEQAAKTTGIAPRTALDRVNAGWELERAISTPPSRDNKLIETPVTSGMRIKSSIRDSWERVWLEEGQAAFEEQLAMAFRKDALKVVREFRDYLPQDAQPKQTETVQKAAVRIELNVASPTTQVNISEV